MLLLCVLCGVQIVDMEVQDTHVNDTVCPEWVALSKDTWSNNAMAPKATSSANTTGQGNTSTDSLNMLITMSCGAVVAFAAAAFAWYSST